MSPSSPLTFKIVTSVLTFKTWIRHSTRPMRKTRNKKSRRQEFSNLTWKLNDTCRLKTSILQMDCRSLRRGKLTPSCLSKTSFSCKPLLSTSSSNCRMTSTEKSYCAHFRQLLLWNTTKRTGCSIQTPFLSSHEMISSAPRQKSQV